MGSGTIRLFVVGLLSGFLLSAATAQEGIENYYRGYPKQKLMDIQQMLIGTGDYAGSVDGLFGAGTLKAVQAYQLRNGSNPVGLLTEDQLQALLADGSKEVKRAGFAVLTDPASGVSIGIPKVYTPIQK